MSITQLIGSKQSHLRDQILIVLELQGNTPRRFNNYSVRCNFSWTINQRNSNSLPSYKKFLACRKKVEPKLLELFGNTSSQTDCKKLMNQSIKVVE